MFSQLLQILFFFEKLEKLYTLVDWNEYIFTFFVNDQDVSQRVFNQKKNFYECLNKDKILKVFVLVLQTIQRHYPQSIFV